MREGPKEERMRRVTSKEKKQGGRVGEGREGKVESC